MTRTPRHPAARVAGGYATVTGATAPRAAIDTAAAVRSATSRNAWAAGDSGSDVTMGLPESPPSRIGC